eukprot:gene17772-23375_t
MKKLAEGETLQQDEKLSIELEEAMSRKIQKKLRSKHNKAMLTALFKLRKNAACKIQSIYRRYKASSNTQWYIQGRKLAIYIQTLYRSRRARRVLAELRRQALILASVIVIQRIYRGYIGRIRYTLKKEFLLNIKYSNDVVSYNEFFPSHLESLADEIERFVQNYSLTLPPIILTTIRGIMYVLNGDSSDSVLVYKAGYIKQVYLYANSLSWSSAQQVLRRKGRLLRRIRALARSLKAANPLRLSLSSDCLSHLKAMSEFDILNYLSKQVISSNMSELSIQCVEKMYRYCLYIYRVHSLQNYFPEYFIFALPAWFRKMQSLKFQYEQVNLQLQYLSICQQSIDKKRRACLSNGRNVIPKTESDLYFEKLSVDSPMSDIVDKSLEDGSYNYMANVFQSQSSATNVGDPMKSYWAWAIYLHRAIVTETIGTTMISITFNTLLRGFSVIVFDLVSCFECYRFINLQEACGLFFNNNPPNIEKCILSLSEQIMYELVDELMSCVEIVDEECQSNDCYIQLTSICRDESKRKDVFLAKLNRVALNDVEMSDRFANKKKIAKRFVYIDVQDISDKDLSKCILDLIVNDTTGEIGRQTISGPDLMNFLLSNQLSEFNIQTIKIKAKGRVSESSTDVFVDYADDDKSSSAPSNVSKAIGFLSNVLVPTSFIPKPKKRKKLSDVKFKDDVKLHSIIESGSERSDITDINRNRQFERSISRQSRSPTPPRGPRATLFYQSKDKSLDSSSNYNDKDSDLTSSDEENHSISSLNITNNDIVDELPDTLVDDSSIEELSIDESIETFDNRNLISRRVKAPVIDTNVIREHVVNYALYKDPPIILPSTSQLEKLRALFELKGHINVNAGDRTLSDCRLEIQIYKQIDSHITSEADSLLTRSSSIEPNGNSYTIDIYSTIQLNGKILYLGEDEAVSIDDVIQYKQLSISSLYTSMSPINFSQNISPTHCSLHISFIRNLPTISDYQFFYLSIYVNGRLANRSLPHPLTYPTIKFRKDDLFDFYLPRGHTIDLSYLDIYLIGVKDSNITFRQDDRRGYVDVYKDLDLDRGIVIGTIHIANRDLFHLTNRSIKKHFNGKVGREREKLIKHKFTMFGSHSQVDAYSELRGYIDKDVSDRTVSKTNILYKIDEAIDRTSIIRSTSRRRVHLSLTGLKFHKNLKWSIESISCELRWNGQCIYYLPIETINELATNSLDVDELSIRYKYGFHLPNGFDLVDCCLDMLFWEDKSTTTSESYKAIVGSISLSGVELCKYCSTLKPADMPWIQLRSPVYLPDSVDISNEIKLQIRFYIKESSLPSKPSPPSSYRPNNSSLNIPWVFVESLVTNEENWHINHVVDNNTTSTRSQESVTSNFELSDSLSNTQVADVSIDKIIISSIGVNDNRRRNHIPLELPLIDEVAATAKIDDDGRVCWRSRIIPKFANQSIKQEFTSSKSVFMSRSSRLIHLSNIFEVKVGSQISYLTKEVYSKENQNHDEDSSRLLPIVVKEVSSEGPGIVKRLYRIEIFANNGSKIGYVDINDETKELIDIIGHKNLSIISDPTSKQLLERDQWTMPDVFLHIENNKATDKVKNSLTATSTTSKAFKTSDDITPKYGVVAIGTYFGLYVTTLGSIFLSLDYDLFNSASFGLDPNTAIKKVCDLFLIVTGSSSLPDFIHNNPKVGTFAIAWFMTKFTEPIRLGLTLAALPTVAKLLAFCLYGFSEKSRSNALILLNLLLAVEFTEDLFNPNKKSIDEPSISALTFNEMSELLLLLSSIK